MEMALRRPPQSPSPVPLSFRPFIPSSPQFLVCPNSVHIAKRDCCVYMIYSNVLPFHPFQECTGSICLAYGLESCQCAQGPDDPETKACELCCKEPGDAEGATCRSSFQLNEMPFDVPDMYAKPGTPCNDYKGYCDVFQKCREVSSSRNVGTWERGEGVWHVSGGATGRISGAGHGMDGVKMLVLVRDTYGSPSLHSLGNIKRQHCRHTLFASGTARSFAPLPPPPLPVQKREPAFE